ncbi:MAG: helix-turn-helix domain-containing protein [Bacteroidales bacterium]
MVSIYHIGIAQAWFAALLVYRKPNKGSADNLLIVWLLVIGLEMLYSLLNLKYATWLPDLIIIPFSYGPFLYYYTKLLISKKPSFPKRIFVHLLPAYAFIFISIIWQKPIDIDAVNFLHKGAVTWLSVANFALFFISMLYYWLMVFRLIKNHNQTLSDHFSYRSDTIKLNWLRVIALWILGGFLGSALTFFVFFLRNIFPFNPIEIFHLGLLVFSFSISYYGIHQPVLYKREKQKRAPQKQVILKDENHETGERLKQLMLQGKPYLNSELTIQDLAEQLNESSSAISNYLNKDLGVNFFTYINGFRIEEAKLRLSDPEHKNDTLLGIAFDSGFNSKSSFNTLFKRSTGMTPSEYRKINKK